MKLLVLAALLAAPQEKIKLEVRSVKGEKYLHESRESNEGMIILSFGGMDLEQPLQEKEVRKYRDEVLEVEGVLPAKVRRETKEWWQEKSGPGAPEAEKTVKALQGKTITMKRDGLKTAYEGAEGIPEPELRKNRLRPESILKALPKQPVAVGETWPVDEKVLLEDLAEEGDAEGPKIVKAKGSGKLEKIEQHKGARCAVVLLTIQASGHLASQEAVKLDMTLNGRLWIDLDKGRPITMRGEGSGKITGQVEQGDQKISMKGDFKIRSETDQTYE